MLDTVMGIMKIQDFWDVTPCRLVAVKDVVECLSLCLQCQWSQVLFLGIILYHNSVLGQCACSHCCVFDDDNAAVCSNAVWLLS